MTKEIINDRYELQEVIGGGGMADVYLAYDTILNRSVAVKVLKLEFSQDQDFIARFRREAQAATSLSHPNVVNIYDVGEEGNWYYIVMEYVSGMTLKQWIQNQGRLSLQETVQTMRQIIAAISHAHENRIVHRDIKPHNILIRDDGAAKVTDFGIARAVSEATITRTNSVLGSVHYLSPEQARGGHVTEKSDLYALGVVMYEMLTGKVPYEGDTAVSVAIHHLQTPFPSAREKNPSIPQSVENVIIKATAKDPLQRVASAGEMEIDLTTVLNPERSDEPPVTIDEGIDEQTKAIPIVNEQDEQHVDDQETLITKPNQDKTSENFDNTEKKTKSRRRKYTIGGLIAFVLLITSFWLLSQWLYVEEVTVPDDLVGEPYEDAIRTLMDLDLDVERELTYDDEIEEDHIVRHRPDAGSTVKVNSTVTLYVSEGKEPIEMPDVIGRSESAALRGLHAFDDIEITYETTSDVDDGTVLDQDPSPEEQIVASETSVTLTVSERPSIHLNNLLGLSREDVREYFAEEEYLIGDFVQEYSSTYEEGRVIDQDPSAFTEIDEMTEVTVIFSRGPDPDEDDGDLEMSEDFVNGHIPFNIDVPEGGEEGTFDVRLSILDSTTDEPIDILNQPVDLPNEFNVPSTLEEGEVTLIFLEIDGEEHGDSPFEYSFNELEEFEDNE
ncbi:Stk1 family PASTA domain-containing Ser/Thr kinase [Texcoconibacillus texcoconensis]|uniref:Serine/threonine-protein kinase PrkC n=1 Tax=Texcoconibacillus texcoconensis TaxID=1095777 RepID=A0A840QL87_9BACI|nr:Stk1 family PASTA domain-containing Ser/Thr kinase [Texcoconibacillus texcoconensis]MBB5172127.1 serine/threonine-protein kinase [Texcoconibacillus texcoconensis]